LRGRSGVSSRPITTFGEAKADPRYLTPVTLEKPLLRTCYGPIEDFLRQNPSYKDEIKLLPKQPGTKVDFFMVGETLWAADVDATIPELIHDTVVRGAKILNVTPEQLGDVACFKNLNHPSNNRDSNRKLYGAVFDALLEVQREFNQQMFQHFEVTSHPRNPKFPREDLEHVLKERDLTSEIINESVLVVSVDNSGDRELTHKSKTVRISPAAAAAPRPQDE